MVVSIGRLLLSTFSWATSRSGRGMLSGYRKRPCLEGSSDAAQRSWVTERSKRPQICSTRAFSGIGVIVGLPCRKDFFDCGWASLEGQAFFPILFESLEAEGMQASITSCQNG